MRRKFLKKIISILCAGSMLVSVSYSVFSIKTNSCNEKIKEAVFECNEHINHIKPQISIYMEKLTDQMNRLVDEKNREYFAAESEKISQVTLKLSKIQQLFQKMDALQLDNPNKFNIFDFNKELMDLEAYMVHTANHNNINIDEILAIVKRIDVDYWNARTQIQSEENKVFSQFDKNIKSSEKMNSGGTLEEKVEVCLKNLEKNSNALKNNESHMELLEKYAKKYISEYEVKNLEFVEKNFLESDIWMLAFDKYLGSGKFVKQVIESFKKTMLKQSAQEIVYDNVKEPVPSTISSLNCFLERVIVSTFKKTTDQTSQFFSDEYELNRYLSYILELKNTINYIKEKTIMAPRYDEFSLNFSAVKLKELERIFENMFKDLTATNWIATLSMTNSEINKAKNDRKITINFQNKNLSNRDLAIIDLIRSTCSPMSKIMTIAVNNKLDAKKLNFSQEDLIQIKNSFEELDSNIQRLYCHLYIIKSDSGRFKVRYSDSEHIFGNNALPKPKIQSHPESPVTVVFLENFNNPMRGPILNNNLPFPGPPVPLSNTHVFGQSPFDFPLPNGQFPMGPNVAGIAIDIPMYINAPVANNVNEIDTIISNAIRNVVQAQVQNMNDNNSNNA